MRRIAIVGGGLSGLSLAFMLRRDPFESVVLESEERTGGKIRTETAHGLLCEWGPTSFHEGEPAMATLIDDLGLTPHLLRGAYASGKTQPAAQTRVQTFAELLAPPDGSPEVSFLEGMEQLTLALRDQVASAIRTSMRVTSLEPLGSGYQLTVGTETLQADAVALTTPSDVAAGIVRHLDPAAAEALVSIQYEPITVLHAAYRTDRRIEGYGLLVSKDDPPQMPGGLLRISAAPRVGKGSTLAVHARFDATGNLAAASEADLWQRIRAESSPHLDHLESPFFERWIRHDRALPVYAPDHEARVAVIEAAERKHPGIYFVGNAYRGRKTPDCVRDAARAASLIRQLA